MARQSALFVIILVGFWISVGYTATTNELNSRTQQLQTEYRLDQIRQDLKAQSSPSASSSSGQPGFAPSLFAYQYTPRTAYAISPEQLKRYLKLLGDPAEQTGIYAYPPEERLFYYGQLCIEVGLVEEGVRAISEHTRIQAEAASGIR